MILSTLNIYCQNLLPNGDFGIFNTSILTPAKLGYNSNYNQVAYNFGNATVPRQYAITNNPNTVSPSKFRNFSDHTTNDGTGNMMVVDGDSNEIFWKQYPDKQLQAGITYMFTFWTKNANTLSDGLNPAAVIKINPVNCTSCIPQNITVGNSASEWSKVTYSITPSSAQYIRIELSTVNAIAGGNEFAIDDISLTESLNISSVNSSNIFCPQNSDGTIAVNASGGTGPYTYNLTGAATLSNATGIFTSLEAGTYNVSVTDNDLSTVNYPTQITITAPINDLTISASTTTVCSATSIPLIASGGYGNYVWTSDTSAAIAGLSATSGANVTATPTATTIYTLTSDNNVNEDELLINGGFEAGVIVPFTTTGYNLKAAPGGNSSVGQYIISGNPEDLSTDFQAGCVPHGGAMMFMADASTSSTATIVEQTVTVVPGVNYQLSYFIQSLGNISGNRDPSPSKIQVYINDVLLNDVANNPSACNWIEAKGIWNSGASTSAKITLKNSNLAAVGNDFAIDDVSFKAIRCKVEKKVTITISSSITPTFLPVTAICSGETLAPLPTSSIDATPITGTWSPALDNTQTKEYTFKPTAGQCAAEAKLTINVNPKVTPTFLPVTPICSGDALSALPTSSIDATPITGTWSPALDNTATKTYTFTPSAGQCSTATLLVITVNQKATPTFSPVTPICSGDALSALPTSSIDATPITGTWSPALDNTATKTYTFTPSAGQCSTATLLVITVNQKATPTFSPVTPICSGDALSALPTSSIDATPITGTWSPALDNTQTTEYIFKPTAGQCATEAKLTITVNNPTVTITTDCINTDFTLKAITSDAAASYKWYKGTTLLPETSNTLIVKSPDNYKVVVNNNTCAAQAIENVTSFYCDIPRGISPNSDGKNDFLDLSNFKVEKLEIFNRYGMKVYSKSNYKMEWDGKTDSGQELPDATYYYVVKFESGNSKTGWIYINR